MSRVAIAPAVDCLTPFVDAGILEAADVHFAAMLARIANPSDCVLLAAALAVRAPRFGHVGVDLASVDASVTSADATVDVDALPWPDAAPWIEEVSASELVQTGAGGVGNRVLPLVWEHGLLYLQRYWQFEVAVAEHLRTRSTAERPFSDADPTAVLEELFGSGDEPNLQRDAADAALRYPMTVIAGGPGTGKTFTVARLLAAMSSLGGEELDIALAAPTGKAAARMTEAVKIEVAGSDLAPEVSAHLNAIEASTIHRLLKPRGPGKFAHNASNPLPHDVIVIDEMSMVSLPLMARFLDAVRPETRLVLVGDPFQLASIEAGSVLGDVVESATASKSSNTVVLQRMHRFGAESPIARLAGAIRAGDTENAIALLESGEEELRWVKPDDQGEMARLRSHVVLNAADVMAAAAAGDADAALQAIAELKVISAQRRRPNGVYAWNNYIEARATESGHRLNHEWYVGRPVMVTNNDYRTELFNGDLGVVVQHEGQKMVAFPGVEGIRYFEPARLDDVDTLWAMTIHKSQGSEFEEVIVSLPPDWSPLLTRELLYTAVTRARKKLVVVASEETLQATINSSKARATALEQRLVL